MSDIQAILLSLGTIIAIPVFLTLLVRVYLGSSKRAEEESGNLPSSLGAVQNTEANADSNQILITILTAAIAAREATSKVNPMIRDYRR